MKRCKYFFIVYAIAILSGTGASAATVTGLATPNYVDGALTETLKGLTHTVSGSGNVVTNVTQANGKVTVTKGSVQATLVSGTNIKTINNTTLLGNGNIEVQVPLGYTAENSGNKVQDTTLDPSNNVVIPDATSKTKYPSMAVAQAIAVKAVTDNTMELKADINTLLDDVYDLQTKTGGLGELAYKDSVGTSDIDANAVTAAKVAAGLIANGTNTTASHDSSSGVYKVNVATANGTNTLGVVKQGANTTISNGVVSVATGTPSTLGVVKVGQIPSGSATSTTYAQIWVQ